MNEFELIARLTRDLPAHPAVVAGPGDDCALIDLGVPDRWVVLKTDAVAEGVHFTRETPSEQVGHKALGRVLSDFAAAAAQPKAVLVTLALPTGFEAERVEGVYRGLRRLADRWSVALVGGETIAHHGPLSLSVAAVGWVARDRVVRRSGGQPGDALFVTGELGGSREGRHLDFEPRLEEAWWLAEHFLPHAMVDLSDGLAGDLRHLMTASRVGADLMQSALPISAAARRRARAGEGAKSPVLAALTDGEDFELLMAVPSGQAVRLLDGWKSRFPGVRLSCIGRLTNQPGLRLCEPGGVRTLADHGHVHFS